MFRLFGKSPIKRVDFTPKSEAPNAPLNHQLQQFLDVQHLQLSMGQDLLELRDDGEKYRYLHFVLGASDFLSHAIEDQTQAHAWFTSIGIVQALEIFKKQDKAIDAVIGYGDEGNFERFNAGREGWIAMKEFHHFTQSAKTDEDVRQAKMSSMRLTSVVRGH